MRTLILSSDLNQVINWLPGDQVASAKDNPNWAGLVIRLTQHDVLPGDPVPEDVHESPVIVVHKVDFFRRMEEAEVDQVLSEVMAVGGKMQGIFNAVNSFRSDAPEWGMLMATAISLFGETRAQEILAHSD